MRTVNPLLRARRRTELLDAAAACFAERGFAQTRTADVSARAGMSSGNLFHYFPTKQALLLALLDREAREVSAVPVPTTAHRARETLADLLREICRLADDPVHRGLAMEVAAVALRDQEVAERYRRNDEVLRSTLGSLAQAGGSRVPAPQAATWLAALTDGVFTRAAVQDDFAATDEFARLWEITTDLLGWSGS